MRSDAIYHGLNYDKEQDDYVKCARCGFPCKLSRDIQSSEGSRVGWGMKYESYTSTDSTIIYDDPNTHYESGDSGVYDKIVDYDEGNTYYESDQSDSAITYDSISSSSIYDPIVTSGCPQCGTLLYNK